MGFGDNTEKVFQTEECIEELAKYIKSLNKKVSLVGFSLGAQLAFKLVAEYEDLFQSAIIVSPWLIKDESELLKAEELNIKQYKQLQNKFMCRLIGTINGLPPKACKEFVLQMQNVKEQTIRNIVYNGITIESVSRFADVSIPVIALAGGKEQADILNSVRKMAEINRNCTFEIWDKAAHNIPPMFAKRFNELICSVV